MKETVLREKNNILFKKFFCFAWIGSLTFLAGAINICAIVLFGISITHYTGNISHAAVALGSGQLLVLGKLLAYIIIFFTGSVIAGFLFHRHEADLSKNHGLLPILFGISLLAIYKGFNSKEATLCILALGMGIQNGTCIRMNNVLVRTTHMTGYITDAAYSLVAVLKGNVEQVWKLRFFLISILVYFTGGLISFIAVNKIGNLTIVVLAILYIVHGIIISLGYAMGVEQGNRIYSMEEHHSKKI